MPRAKKPLNTQLHLCLRDTMFKTNNQLKATLPQAAMLDLSPINPMLNSDP